MKSGPTLNGATRCPARRSAPIKPVASVVFPLPEAGAAMTIAGVVVTRHPRGATRHSPLDALLPLAPCVHRVLHLGHLGDQVGGLDQPRGGIASGDHHI